jgi:hypothetical protein
VCSRTRSPCAMTRWTVLCLFGALVLRLVTKRRKSSGPSATVGLCYR